MLRRQIIVIILIFILSFVLVSCSSNRQNSEFGNNATINDMSISENANNNIMIAPAAESKDILVKNISKIYQRLQKNDGKSLDVIMDKNIIWKYEGVEGIVPFAGVYTGKAGVKKFWRDYLASVIIQKAELRYYLRQGNALHLHWAEWGIARSTGKKFVMETVQIWEFNEKGALVKFRWYNDTFALYNAFQPNTDPQLSLAQHPEDYYINGDGPVDALAVVQKMYQGLLTGDIPTILSLVADNNVFIIAGPHNIAPTAGTRLGPLGAIEFFSTLASTEEYYGMNVLLTKVVDGCRVDAEFNETMHVFATNKVVYNEGIHSFVINSKGQIINFRSYNDTYQIAWSFTK